MWHRLILPEIGIINSSPTREEQITAMASMIVLALATAKLGLEREAAN
jgi:hypothetical protein